MNRLVKSVKGIFTVAKSPCGQTNFAFRGAEHREKEKRGAMMHRIPKMPFRRPTLAASAMKFCLITSIHSF